MWMARRRSIAGCAPWGAPRGRFQSCELENPQGRRSSRSPRLIPRSDVHSFSIFVRLSHRFIAHLFDPLSTKWAESLRHRYVLILGYRFLHDRAVSRTICRFGTRWVAVYVCLECVDILKESRLLHDILDIALLCAGGGDGNVKVWSLATALDAAKEASSAPKLLSTLTDHNGQVNIVRFAPHASLLASGSDDFTAVIYELHDGPGGGVLGGEVNLENWRTKFLLRGHTSNVVDLSWSPDGGLLATASLDNSVIVWDTNTGKQVKTITHHKSFVKGVAFDPVGTYLATYSDDKSVVIWKRDDWSIAGIITHPYRQMMSTTFAVRLSWSPDGTYVMMGNSFQGSTHVAVAVPREGWDDKDKYLLICGHRGAVVSPSFSPKLYHVPPLGGGKPAELLTAVFALGSYDGKVSVWAASTSRAYFVGKQFFSAQVLDVAWTPDGRAVLACSADKSVACFQFDESELGPVATKDELAQLMLDLYGSTNGKPGSRRLVETAELLALEQRNIKDAAAKGGNQMDGKTARTAIQALDARMGDGAVGFGSGPSVAGAGAGANLNAADVVRGQNGLHMQPASKLRAEPSASRGAKASTPQKRARDLPQREQVSRAALAPLPKKTSLTYSWNLEDPTTDELLGDVATSFLDAMKRGRAVLTATNDVCTVAQCNFSQIRVEGPDGTWSDLIRGSVVSAVGSREYCVVGMADGHVLVYSPSGRRRCPPLCVGSGISRMIKSTARSEDNMNRIAVVSTSGVLRVVDPVGLRQVAKIDLVPVLEGGRTIVDLALSSSGSPLVSLSDSSAYTWDANLACWTQVLDESTVISDFYPLSNKPGEGDVGNLQSKARASAQAALLGSSNKVSNARYHVSRSHLEGNLSAAVAIGSKREVDSFLKSYALLLVQSDDEMRLKGLIDDLICGKITGDEVYDRNLLKGCVIPVMISHRQHAKLVERCQDILNDLGVA